MLQDSVDAMLQGREATVQVRERDADGRTTRVREVAYSETLEREGQVGPATSSCPWLDLPWVVEGPAT
jgi:hypothetical protein